MLNRIFQYKRFDFSGPILRSSSINVLSRPLRTRVVWHVSISHTTRAHDLTSTVTVNFISTPTFLHVVPHSHHNVCPAWPFRYVVRLLSLRCDMKNCHEICYIIQQMKPTYHETANGVYWSPSSLNSCELYQHFI